MQVLPSRLGRILERTSHFERSIVHRPARGTVRSGAGCVPGALVPVVRQRRVHGRPTPVSLPERLAIGCRPDVFFLPIANS